MFTFKIDNTRIASGLIFLAIGVFAGIYALHYRIGSATEMGPGYFPLGVACLLAVLGLLSIVSGLRTRERGVPAGFHLATLMIVAGVALFGFVNERCGFAPAVGVLTVMVCYQRWLNKPLEVIVMTVCLMLLTSVLFVYLLGMPFTLFHR